MTQYRPIESANAGPLSETDSHVLRTSETNFDITCLRLDDDFVDFFNARFGTTWDGTLPGSRLTTIAAWGQFFPGLARILISATAGPVITINDFVAPVTQIYEIGVAAGPQTGLPQYSTYTRQAPVDASFPVEVTLTPCDVSSPPEFVIPQTNFFDGINFETPDGLIGSYQPTLELMSDELPYEWRKTILVPVGSEIYQLDFRVIIDEGGPYVLEGCTKLGDPMGYAEFDPVDTPSFSSGWPVGRYLEGDDRGLDSLPAGITIHFLSDPRINVIAGPS